MPEGSEVPAPLRETDVKSKAPEIGVEQLLARLRDADSFEGAQLAKQIREEFPDRIMVTRRVEVEFKKLSPRAQTPSYAKPGDAGCDLTAVGILESQDYIEYDTGIAVAIPRGYVGLIFPRSSVSKKDLILANCVGVVDSGYRGPIKCRFKVVKDHTGRQDLTRDPLYRPGDRVCQLVVIPFPQVTYREVEELDETDRGEGGFGSTGG